MDRAPHADADNDDHTTQADDHTTGIALRDILNEIARARGKAAFL